MTIENRFDLCGRDVLATSANRILLSIHEIEIALGVRSRNVTGMEPEIPEGLHRGLGIVVVGRQHCVGSLRPHQDLAGFARSDGLVTVIGYDHIEGLSVGLATGADPAARTWRRHRDNTRFR